MKVTVISVFITLALASGITIAQTQNCSLINESSPAHAMAVGTAMLEFDKYKLKAEKYRIEVCQTENRIFVSFLDPQRLEGTRGSSPNIPEFGVELSGDDFHVIQASFMR